jgi:hypothetical protein
LAGRRQKRTIAFAQIGKLSDCHDSWFVARAATTERLLLRALAGLKQQPDHVWRPLAACLVIRGSRSEQGWLDDTRGVAHQHEYAALCRLSCLKTAERAVDCRDEPVRVSSFSWVMGWRHRILQLAAPAPKRSVSAGRAAGELAGLVAVANAPRGRAFALCNRARAILCNA